MKYDCAPHTQRPCRLIYAFPHTEINGIQFTPKNRNGHCLARQTHCYQSILAIKRIQLQCCICEAPVYTSPSAQWVRASNNDQQYKEKNNERLTHPWKHAFGAGQWEKRHAYRFSEFYQKQNFPHQMGTWHPKMELQLQRRHPQWSNTYVPSAHRRITPANTKNHPEFIAVCEQNTAFVQILLATPLLHIRCP